MTESEDGVATLYFHNIPSANLLSEVSRFSGVFPAYQMVSVEKLTEVLAHCYHNDSSEALQDAAGISDHLDLTSLADAVPVTEDLLAQSDDAPVIRLINALLTEAIKEGASDVHIETFESTLVVRVRVDGVLREILSLQRTIASLLVSRIKVMARLDIAEKRVPQDGRISLRVAGQEVDVRVSTLPSSNGERVVLRLLDKAAGRLELSHLGMTDQNRLLIEGLLKNHMGSYS